MVVANVPLMGQKESSITFGCYKMVVGGTYGDNYYRKKSKNSG